jgi:hypothetical protein
MLAFPKPLGLFAAVAAASATLCASDVVLKPSGSQIDVIIDGRPFTTYYFDPAVAKPYLMPLRTASGIVLSRPFPVKNDVSAGDLKASSFEPHQRPLYFGHGDINGLDFWSEEAFEKSYHSRGPHPYGHLQLEKAPQIHPSRGKTAFTALFTLRDQKGLAIGQETQTFQFSGEKDLRMIDCRIDITADKSALVIGDTKEGSFGVRLGSALSAPHDRMINSLGAHGEKEIWGKPADWVDYSGTIDGKTVGLAVFDSPRSFRHPTTWHARAYGLLAANPFGWKAFKNDASKNGSYTIPAGKSLTFRYRVLIHEGEFGPDRLAEAYRKYAASEQ